MSDKLGAAPSPGSAHHVSLVLEGTREDGPIKTATAIKGLNGRLVILELQNPWYLAGCHHLKGRPAVLAISPANGGQGCSLVGEVAWTRYGGAARRDLLLGLELARVTAAELKLVEGCLAHTPQDLKGLWDRWDQKHREVSLVNQRVCLGGLILMLAGLALQLPVLQQYRFLGWYLWLLGSLGVLGNMLWAMWQGRAPR